MERKGKMAEREMEKRSSRSKGWRGRKRKRNTEELRYLFVKEEEIDK
jgi:hypothetical protein